MYVCVRVWLLLFFLVCEWMDGWMGVVVDGSCRVCAKSWFQEWIWTPHRTVNCLRIWCGLAAVLVRVDPTFYFSPKGVPLLPDSCCSRGGACLFCLSIFVIHTSSCAWKRCNAVERGPDARTRDLRANVVIVEYLIPPPPPPVSRSSCERSLCLGLPQPHSKSD